MSIFDPAETFNTLAESIGLDDRLRKAIARLGHVRPTLVQSKSLPLAIAQSRDLMVRASTGSGKTLAYLIPALNKLLQRRRRCGVGAVILVPTRELCHQVHSAIQGLTYYCDDVIQSAVLTAGQGRGEKNRVDFERQEAMLRDQIDLIVATPGGLLAQVRNGSLDLRSSIETLVVDEADLVLSFGYSDDVAEIVKALPRIYQGMLMSATLSPELDSLKRVVLNAPVVIKLEKDAAKGALRKLKQFYLTVQKKDKTLVLFVFLKLGLLKGKGLFFVGSTDAGYRLKLFLEQFHIRSSVLNGELPFRSRCNIIEQFNVGNFDYLIATDQSADVADCDDPESEPEDENVMTTNESRSGARKNDSEYGVSRGLDFRHVSFVVNVDFPSTPRSYAHRIGRVARAGADGVALSLVESDSNLQLEALLAVQEDQPKIPYAMAVTENLRPDAAAVAGNAHDQVQPISLDFDLKEIEGFRYRVEDVGRAVTKSAVRETRAAELKAEILNSDRLQNHFEDNPHDLQLLQHDRLATHISRVQYHLKHVPKYLLPRGMQVANLKKKRKRKKVRGIADGARRTDNDPLQSFNGDGVVPEDGMDPLVGFMDDSADEDEPSAKAAKLDDTESKVLFNTRDGTGRSTAGRNAWKEKHRKGRFGDKKRKKDRKSKTPLGI